MSGGVRRHGARRLAVLAACLLATACARPDELPVGPGPQAPELGEAFITAGDGYQLPLHRWETEGDPDAVVLAIHGFMDYGGAFDVLADALNERGFQLYAYDQRGFGSTRPDGVWAGEQRLVDDARLAIRLLHRAHPERPVYVIGKSMGAAVTILALTGEGAPSVAGSVLISPAVWGEGVMPWYQQFGLWLGEAVTPGMRLSVQLAQALGNEPTDDPEVLARQEENPDVQRDARVDTIEGLAELMDSALERSQALPGPSLILYGLRDDIIPPEPVCILTGRLPDPEAVPWQFVLYPDGYHMLTRYTGAEQVHGDILAWLEEPGVVVPSGKEVDRDTARRALCRR